MMASDLMGYLLYTAWREEELIRLEMEMIEEEERFIVWPWDCVNAEEED